MSAITAKALEDIDVLVEKVSSVTGLSTQAISTQLEEANVKAFRLNDVILISPDDFDSIIDSWADSIKAKLSIKDSAVEVASTAPSTSSPSTPSKIKSTTKKAKTKSTTAKSTAKKAKTKATKAKPAASKAASSKSSGKGLAWPKGFENHVSHLYTHTLKRILPEDEAQKKSYLEAIANETAAGKKLADELVTAIVSRSTRTLAPEKVMSGLIAKCASMLA